jgi:GMP synthase (glutamine-hydrolysing)
VSPFALVVQHDAADTPGAIGRALEGSGIEPRDVRGFAGDAVPETIGFAAALVVMGGAMSVDDLGEHPFLRSELRLIDSALRASVPVLGVCLGAQLLAKTLGGRVVRDGATEIGWLPVERTSLSESDPLFEGLPPCFVPFHWHSDVIVLPPGATRLAWSERTEVQAFRAGAPSSGVYGLQFHVEGDAGMIETMVRSSAGELAERGIDGNTVLGETSARIAEQERIARILFGRWAEAAARLAG